MIYMKKLKLAACLILIAVFLLAGVTAAAGPSMISSKNDLNKDGIKVGVGEGGAAMLIVEKELPKAEIVYLDGISGYEAVALGKIDAYIYDRRQMQLAIDNGRKGVRLLKEDMDEGVHVAVGLSPVSGIPDLENRLNTFIDKLKKDGTLDDMYKRWVINKDETMPETDVPVSSEAHLVVGTTGIVPPYSYYKGADLTGYDIELARRFASFLNATLEFKIYDYNGIIPAASSGDVDCVMANLNITPERAEALTFSHDLYEEKIGILVRSTGDGDKPSFLEMLKSGIEKNFIREDRWMLFINGIIITLFITLLSCVLGTVLGFILLILNKDGNPFINRITDFSMWLIQGMPLVVLLMILYYIVFMSLKVNGFIVSVIAFTMVFGFEVYGLLKMGVSVIDKGQYEAAYALGYTGNATFYKIIFPQILPTVMDSYKAAITALIKSTSIVGYIAVQDLTKIGDIIRSRTYEAFFPLIAIAVIYFLLEGIFSLLVEFLRRATDLRGRKKDRILKGVKTDDKD